MANTKKHRKFIARVTHLYFLSRFLLASIILIVFSSACGPDFTKSGNDGGNISSEPKRGVTYDASRVPPTAPVCGQQYSVSSTARQAVFACNSYDYTPLYNRARASVDFLIVPMNCPEECRPKHVWESYRRWDCADLTIMSFPIFQYASVEKTVLCPRGGDQLPPGLGPPPAVALMNSPNVEGGPPSVSPTVFDEIGDTVEIQCRVSEVALLEYSEDVAACQPHNFQPIVQRAETLARTYHGSLTCAPGCNKLPYLQLRREWKCIEATAPAPALGIPARFAVQVDVYFQVDCQ